MPPVVSGFNPATIGALVSGAGFYTIGGTDAGAYLGGVTLLGATTGGSRIAWGVNTSQVQVDGVGGARVRGLRRRNPYTTSLSTTLATLSDADIQTLFGSAFGGTSPKILTLADVNTYAAAGESINGLRLWLKRGDGKWPAIHMPSAFPVPGDVTTADSTDVGFPVEFQAETLYDPADPSSLDAPPFSIEVWDQPPQIA
jgi:hypothetical protein